MPDIAKTDMVRSEDIDDYSPRFDLPRKVEPWGNLLLFLVVFWNAWAVGLNRNVGEVLLLGNGNCTALHKFKYREET